MKKLVSVLMLLIPFSTYAKNPDRLNQSLQEVLEHYLTQHQKSEHLTGISMSVSLPKENKVRNYFIGKVSHERKAEPVNAHTLFQIGGITQSFTAAIILQLEAEKKLNIHQTLGFWLPQYPAWKDVTIKQLLNMTSGIPDYFTHKKFQEDTEKDRQWTVQELIGLSYPNHEKKWAYDYSHTNYLLLQLIIEKATQGSFSREMDKRLLLKYSLNNTFYADMFYPEHMMKRMMHGYDWKDEMPALKGKDITFMNMSFAQGAGGMVSTSEDMIRWVKLLFSTTLYPKKQLNELTRMVSTKTGKPLKNLTHQEAEGFALGVFSKTFPNMGRVWFYKGNTLGYRAVYAWIPCNHIVVSAILNSQVDKDHATELLTESYKKILNLYPKYRCKKKG